MARFKRFLQILVVSALLTPVVYGSAFAYTQTDLDSVAEAVLTTNAAADNLKSADDGMEQSLAEYIRYHFQAQSAAKVSES